MGAGQDLAAFRDRSQGKLPSWLALAAEASDHERQVHR